jgi:predicted phosphodiesterase
MSVVDLPFTCFVISDMHMEQDSATPDKCLRKLPDAEVLVLAGDIGHPSEKRWRRFLQLCSAKYEQVVYVLGNHEQWDGFEDPARNAELVRDLPNVHVLENSVFSWKGVHFAGCTLWTDGRGHPSNPVTPEAIASMNDFDRIRGWSAERMRAVHARSVAFLEQCLDKLKNCVVVTHHSPDFDGISPVYQGESLNGLYASDLTRLYDRPNLKAWVYGHTHHFRRESVGEGGSVLLLSNPGRSVHYKLQYSQHTQETGWLSVGRAKGTEHNNKQSNDNSPL